jgi:hypothetical protein
MCVWLPVSLLLTRALFPVQYRFVSGFAIQAARESALLYYGAIILWEFVLLPLVCYVKTVHTGIDNNEAIINLRFYVAHLICKTVYLT